MITVKDFDHFMDHRTIDFGGIFDKNLFNLKGKANLLYYIFF